MVRSRSTIVDLGHRPDPSGVLDWDARRVIDTWNRANRIAAVRYRRRSGVVSAGLTMYWGAVAGEHARATALLAAASAHELLVDGAPLRALGGPEREAEVSLGLLELAGRMGLSSSDSVRVPPRSRPHARYRFAAADLAVTSGDHATLDVDSEAFHPLFGRGVSVRLELPLEFIDTELAAAVASELNDSEATTETGVAGYGAWATLERRPHAIAHVAFLPHVVARLIGFDTIRREEQ
jgi:hypothetical protein